MSAVMERDLAFVVGKTKAVQDIDAQIEALQVRRVSELGNLLEDLDFMDIPLVRVTFSAGERGTVGMGDRVHLMHQKHEGDSRWSRYWAHSAETCTGDGWCRSKDGEYKALRGGRRGTRLVHARVGTFVCLAINDDELAFAQATN